MGGGLFGTTLYLNPKCLVFSLFMIAVYLLPVPASVPHKIVMSFLLGTSAYIILAWYDVLYDCNDRLKPTLLGWLSAPFKPPEYAKQLNELPVKTQKIIRYFDVGILSILVITFLYPFFHQSAITRKLPRK
jgi:VanZ family protein